MLDSSQKTEALAWLDAFAKVAVEPISPFFPPVVILGPVAAMQIVARMEKEISTIYGFSASASKLMTDLKGVGRLFALDGFGIAPILATLLVRRKEEAIKAIGRTIIARHEAMLQDDAAA